MLHKLCFDAHTYQDIDESLLKKHLTCHFTFEKIKQRNSDDVLNALSIIHPDIFGYNYILAEYEQWYVDLFKHYGDFLISIGFEDFSIFQDVFCVENEDGNFTQCNFEIFNKNNLQTLAKYSASLPISMHIISIEDSMRWLNINDKEKFSYTIGQKIAWTDINAFQWNVICSVVAFMQNHPLNYPMHGCLTTRLSNVYAQRVSEHDESFSHPLNYYDFCHLKGIATLILQSKWDVYQKTADYSQQNIKKVFQIH